jgi:hypothetical protein
MYSPWFLITQGYKQWWTYAYFVKKKKLKRHAHIVHAPSDQTNIFPVRTNWDYITGWKLVEMAKN